MLSKSRFLQPCLPTLTKVPPVRGTWVHEVKFNGYRVQIHKDGKHVTLYSKNGNDFTERYEAIAEAVARMPTNAVILDAELTACASDGSPDFRSLLMRRDSILCVWVFDILSQHGKDLQPLTLAQRRDRLGKLMARVSDAAIRYSESFSDPRKLLKACAEHKLEGIVSKRLDKPYRAGPSKAWIKVKCARWREENSWRHEFFQRS